MIYYIVREWSAPEGVGSDVYWIGTNQVKARLAFDNYKKRENSAYVKYYLYNMSSNSPVVKGSSSCL